MTLGSKFYTQSQFSLWFTPVAISLNAWQERIAALIDIWFFHLAQGYGIHRLIRCHALSIKVHCRQVIICTKAITAKWR